MSSVETVLDLAPALCVSLEAAVRAAALETGKEIVEEAQRSIREYAKHGRAYRRDEEEYTASAPGEPPANVSGDLADSITVEPTEDGAEVKVTDRIAHTMEFGSEGGKVAARPFLVPAVESQREAHKARIADALRGGLGS